MKKGESAQVLLSGVVMIVLLLLLILYMFDVHNVLRGKLKLETGQQAAALTGAAWQRNSLNLIGELNLFKACAVLLEGEENWNTPLPEVPDLKKLTEEEYRQKLAERRSALQGRIDLLTEMQTRIAFIGPLIGFAAAQQAAKANGLPSAGRKALDSYLNRVITSYRYRPDFGGANDVINNYFWRDPYISMLQELAEHGIAVYPNVRTARAPLVDPPELAMETFYTDLLRHGEEIAAGDPPEQSSWHDSVYKFAKHYETWTDSHLSGKWWNIDFTLNRFPDESEIFTLGVRNGFSRYSNYSSFDDHEMQIGKQLFSAFSKASGEIQKSVYTTVSHLPSGVNMKWFCYDESWYPEYYSSISSSYASDHYDYWFGGNALRKKVKQQYRYEGPAAYAESADVHIDRIVRQRADRSARKVLHKREQRSVHLGPKHNYRSDSESYATDYRPGAIARTFGELENGNPPVAVPLVLPVFSKVALMPTYMPIPAGFSVLRDYQSNLDTFLNFLAAEESLARLKHPLPAGCEEYLQALKLLLNRRKFLNYGYNPHCTVTVNREMLLNWPKIRKEHVYTQKNLTGLGWLQEPKHCTDTISGIAATQREVQVEDFINGGMALRIYDSINSFSYYVINSKGNVVTNDDLDPTIRYNHGGGNCNCGSCTGFGGSTYKPDLDRGPVRL